MRIVTLLPLLVFSMACGEEFRAVPHAELVEDLRAGRIAELHACPDDGEQVYRYLRPDPGEQPERLQVVSLAGVDGAAQLAEAEGIPVHENGELCD